ncbi:MAG: ATP-binding protein, partial [Bacteroidota bacterium]
LELQAFDAKGELLEAQSIPLISKPPIYLQWWFLLSLLIASGVGVYLFYQYRTRNLLEQKTLLEKEVRQRTRQLEADKVIIEQQAEELKQLDETKSRFFANVSHELRTPIQLIQGPIQSVLKDNQFDSRTTTLLQKAKHNSNSLLRLVNEILDLTKLEANKLVLSEEAVVLYALLRRITSNFQSIADAKSIHFNFVYQPKETLQIDLDVDKFEKIINNLLTNAFKFTPKGGRVIIQIIDSTNKADNFLELQIKDNGRGIPPEDVPHVFDRFYQSAANKKAEGGLGIGLALSMEFVKLMHGRMWVESSTTEPHRGSTFYFQFPKKEVLNMVVDTRPSSTEEEQIAGAALSVDNGEARYHLEAATILLVEDNYDMQDYIQLLLAPYYKVIAVGNGQEALEQLALTTVHLMISDVMMPVMDGFEFLTQVKHKEQWRLIPFIMLTARADMQDKMKALRIGVDDYLLKPFKEEELLVRIENLLNNAKERKAFGEVVERNERTDVETTNLSTKDNEWLEKVENLVLKHLTDSRFSVDYLADLLDINRKTLYQKTKILIGLTPNQYIRTIRLQYAKERLEQGKYTSVKAVAQDAGFRSPDYFSKLFIKEFGKNPLEYL